MSTVDTRTMRELAVYLSQAKEHLDDLPPEIQDELLGDLSQMIVEVSAEIDGSVRQLLGSPAEMVAELRSSAGLDPPSPARAGVRARKANLPRFDWDGHSQRILLWLKNHWPDTVVAARHGWWIARAAVLTMLLAMVTTPYPSVGVMLGVPFPAVVGSAILGFALFGLLAIASVSLGRRAEEGGSRRVALAINCLMILGAFYIGNEIANVLPGGPSRTIVFAEDPAAVLGALLDGR